MAKIGKIQFKFILKLHGQNSVNESQKQVVYRFFTVKSIGSCLGEETDIYTPHNVGSVLWRLFSTLEVVQYIGGITSVLWGDNISTVGG